jgi:hypothetical protein
MVALNTGDVILNSIALDKKDTVDTFLTSAPYATGNRLTEDVYIKIRF